MNCSLFGYGFKYISGVYFSIGFDFTHEVAANFNFGISMWHIIINQDDGINIINLNIAALLIIIFIDKQAAKIKSMELAEEISEIGENDMQAS